VTFFLTSDHYRCKGDSDEGRGPRLEHLIEPRERVSELFVRGLGKPHDCTSPAISNDDHMGMMLSLGGP